MSKFRRCEHVWKEESANFNFDASGFHVKRVTLRCEKCGKRHIRKYW